MKQFELLKYDKPNDTDSLSHIGWIELDLDKPLEAQVIDQLSQNGIELKSFQIENFLSVGIIELANKKGKFIFQLRD